MRINSLSASPYVQAASQRPNNTAQVNAVQAAETPSAQQRNGLFDIVVGTPEAVNQHMKLRKAKRDEYGQLSMSSNVVESQTNFELVPPDNQLLYNLTDYIDFNNSVRNGEIGEKAAFIYPLQTASPQANESYEVGIYADDEDLQTFLNFVGLDRWNAVANDAPDRITQFALDYLQVHPKDAQGNPIKLQKLTPPPGHGGKQSPEAASKKPGDNQDDGFLGSALNIFA